MIFVGIDWAEEHHDVCILDADGQRLDRLRIVEGVEGVAQLHARLAHHAKDPEQVVIGIETDRGRLRPTVSCCRSSRCWPAPTRT